jgi:hypothetical protein
MKSAGAIVFWRWHFTRIGTSATLNTITWPNNRSSASTRRIGCSPTPHLRAAFDASRQPGLGGDPANPRAGASIYAQSLQDMARASQRLAQTEQELAKEPGASGKTGARQR